MLNREDILVVCFPICTLRYFLVSPPGDIGPVPVPGPLFTTQMD